MQSQKERLLYILITADEEYTANMGFGVMAALRIYSHRHNITQRHIQLTNKAQLQNIF
jgi:hypothetical protein